MSRILYGTCQCFDVLRRTRCHSRKAKWAERFFLHDENMPMQCSQIFKVVKNENFQKKMFDIFSYFAQNIDCGYLLKPQFYIEKLGFAGVYIFFLSLLKTLIVGTCSARRL